MLNEVERRRSPRVNTVNHPSFPPAVLDVSLGGMAVELPMALPKGVVRDIGLQVGSDPEIVLRMQVAYSRKTRRPDGKLVFVTGLAYLRDVTDELISTPLRLAS